MKAGAGVGVASLLVAGVTTQNYDMLVKSAEYASVAGGAFLCTSKLTSGGESGREQLGGEDDSRSRLVALSAAWKESAKDETGLLRLFDTGLGGLHKMSFREALGQTEGIIKELDRFLCTLQSKGLVCHIARP